MLALSTIAAPGQLPITFQDALNAGDVDAVLALFAPGVGMRTVAGEQIAGEEALRAEIAGSVAACGKLTSVQRHILIGAETAVLVTDWTSAHGRIRALNLLIGSQDIYKSPDIAYWQLRGCADWWPVWRGGSAAVAHGKLVGNEAGRAGRRPSARCWLWGGGLP